MYKEVVGEKKPNLLMKLIYMIYCKVPRAWDRHNN